MIRVRAGTAGFHVQTYRLSWSYGDRERSDGTERRARLSIRAILAGEIDRVIATDGNEVERDVERRGAVHGRLRRSRRRHLQRRGARPGRRGRVHRGRDFESSSPPRAHVVYHLRTQNVDQIHDLIVVKQKRPVRLRGRLIRVRRVSIVRHRQPVRRAVRAEHDGTRRMKVDTVYGNGNVHVGLGSATSEPGERNVLRRVHLAVRAAPVPSSRVGHDAQGTLHQSLRDVGSRKVARAIAVVATRQSLDRSREAAVAVDEFTAVNLERRRVQVRACRDPSSRAAEGSAGRSRTRSPYRYSTAIFASRTCCLRPRETHRTISAPPRASSTSKSCLPLTGLRTSTPWTRRPSRGPSPWSGNSRPRRSRARTCNSPCASYASGRRSRGCKTRFRGSLPASPSSSTRRTAARST
eukprot:31125-Pelagococcus_subviridis.AAC.31